MDLPYFYLPDLSSPRVTLDENNSKHIVQVLRMKAGEELLFTDGKGVKAKAIIEDDNRKRCVVHIMSRQLEPERLPKVVIAISLVKNTSRFEWFLEKATEIGVSEIVPLVCDRTEKEKFRFDRLQAILISAMLQSQQCWLPLLHEPTALDALVDQDVEGQKFIAHCLPGEKNQLGSTSKANTSSLMLIGPEGDFTFHEINKAIARGFVPVALGETRLRTETAGIVAATLLRNASHSSQ